MWAAAKRLNKLVPLILVHAIAIVTPAPQAESLSGSQMRQAEGDASGARSLWSSKAGAQDVGLMKWQDAVYARRQEEIARPDKGEEKKCSRGEKEPHGVARRTSRRLGWGSPWAGRTVPWGFSFPFGGISAPDPLLKSALSTGCKKGSCSPGTSVWMRATSGFLLRTLSWDSLRADGGARNSSELRLSQEGRRSPCKVQVPAGRSLHLTS